MNYPEKFKQGFIKQIEKELNKCEIIYNPNTKGIWFINREEKYWYLEYKIETNYLWWRYEFFNLLKTLLSMPDEVFNEVISRWVENKLNCEVFSIHAQIINNKILVEETLNCKVLSTMHWNSDLSIQVEETLNCKVLSTSYENFQRTIMVEDTLNCKVDSTKSNHWIQSQTVEDTLNVNVVSTIGHCEEIPETVEDTLNCKVESVDFGLTQHITVEETLNLK